MRSVAVFLSAVLAAVLLSSGPAAQQPGSPPGVALGGIAVGSLDGPDEIRRWDGVVDGLARTGGLEVIHRVDDADFPGRRHEYLVQRHEGVEVFGGGVSRQLDEAGVTVSLFGSIVPVEGVSTNPVLSAADVRVRVAELSGGGRPAGSPALGILPGFDDSDELVWRLAGADGYFYYVSAVDGSVLRREDARHQQAYVGTGRDEHGVERKLSTAQVGGRFVAHDRLRPAELVTLDARGDYSRLDRLQYQHADDELPRGRGVWNTDDYARDQDNWWVDTDVVGAHAYSGWAYDYFADRHGWNGVDGADGRAFSLINHPRVTAYWIRAPYGPEGSGMFVYGDRMTNLDIVGHEYMHGVTHATVSQRVGARGLSFVQEVVGPRSFRDDRGVTHYCRSARFWGEYWSSRARRWVEGPLPVLCDRYGRFVLAHRSGGALHEAFSDIFGESLEHYYFARGEDVSADWLVGGDHHEGPIRSLANPARHGHPDSFRHVRRFAVTVAPGGRRNFSRHIFSGTTYRSSLCPRCYGYGGNHWNSLILNHVFYLAVEGGRHRTSGVRINGVGDAGRELVEKIIFRAIRQLLPGDAGLQRAGGAIRQAAYDLDRNGPARRALGKALSAAGI